MKEFLVKTILLAMQQLGEKATEEEKKRLSSLKWEELFTEAQAVGITLDLQGKINAYICQQEIIEREQKKYSVQSIENHIVN